MSGNYLSETEKTKFRLCQSCGNFCAVNEPQIFCIVCGEKMIESCPNCNEPIIYPTGKHCHNCGQTFSREEGE